MTNAFHVTKLIIRDMCINYIFALQCFVYISPDFANKLWMSIIFSCRKFRQKAA